MGATLKGQIAQIKRLIQHIKAQPVASPSDLNRLEGRINRLQKFADSLSSLKPASAEYKLAERRFAKKVFKKIRRAPSGA